MPMRALFKSRLLLGAVSVVVVSLIAVSVVLFSTNTNNTEAQAGSLPTSNTEVVSTFNRFLTTPTSIEHKLFQDAGGDAHTYGQGYIDLRSGCSYGINLTGALYSVDLISDGASLWQRSTKRETGSQGNWEQALPLTSNINSPLLGLTGNGTLMYCNLRDISRVLVAKETGGWDVDRGALANLLAQRRTDELAAMYILAGKTAADAPVVDPSQLGVEAALARLDRVMIEQPSDFQLKILFIGKGEFLMEEITLSRASEQTISAPAVVEQRGDRTEEARQLLGIEN